MNYITFGNDEYTLCFNSENGYLEKVEYLGKPIELGSKLWSVCTASGELGIDNMKSFCAKEYEDVLKLFWKNEKALVTVNLKNDENKKIRMNLSVDLYDEDAINDVRFPIIGTLSSQKDDYLLITWQNGHLLKNSADNFFSKGMEVPFWVGRGKYGYENEYPAALSFQYTTYYCEDYGFYFATEDSDAYIKSFAYDYKKDKNGIDFSVVNYPENMGKTRSYCMNYDFVFKMYAGDWQTATAIYRDWAINQKWCKTKLCEKTLPDSVANTDLWRINHTNYELGTRTQEFFDASVKLRDETDSKLALHWYGWNMGVHDKDYPEYISDEMTASGWREELKEWNRKFDEEGIYKIPYHNARLWEKKTKTWQTEKAYLNAIKDQNGELLDEPWMPWMGYELKAMCPATSAWQEKVADLCREYGTELGFDGVYLDQVASYNATLCFDETHPHPIGGGTWWNDTYHRMLRRVRDIVGDNSVVTTESCCETYVDVFDLFLVLDTCFEYTAFNAMDGGNTVSVPLFNLIYGDYALSYGSICRYSDRIDRFEYNLIRNTIWGFLPTVEGLDLEQVENGKEYLKITKRVVDFYKENKDIFLYGRLAEIPEYECDMMEMDWDASYEGKIKFNYTKSFKAVCASVWQTKDNEKVLFAYNYSDAKKTIDVGGKKYEIEPKSFFAENI